MARRLKTELAAFGEKETPRTKMLLLLLAQGMPERECAERMGTSTAWVRGALEQEWFKEKLGAIMAAVALPSIEKLLRQAAMESIATLRELAMGAASETVRVQAASAMARISLGDKVNLSAVPRNLDELEREVQRQSAEIAALPGGPDSTPS